MVLTGSACAGRMSLSASTRISARLKRVQEHISPVNVLSLSSYPHAHNSAQEPSADEMWDLDVSVGSVAQRVERTFCSYDYMIDADCRVSLLVSRARNSGS